MVKTSTSTNPPALSKAGQTPAYRDVAQIEDELFYDSIKPQLNQLIKAPSEATIELILAHAIRK